jgi:hypothetical protein
MVTLPPEFVATKFPGYFLNIKTMEVYSIKIDGVLKKLKPKLPCHWNHYRAGYRVSHHGQPRWLDKEYLKTIVPHDSVIGVAGE